MTASRTTLPYLQLPPPCGQAYLGQAGLIGFAARELVESIGVRVLVWSPTSWGDIGVHLVHEAALDRNVEVAYV
jgi:hypothetical protein